MENGALSAVGVLVAVIAAGCLGAVDQVPSASGEPACEPGPPTPRPSTDLAAKIDDGPFHSHADPSQHTGAHHLEPVGFTPLTGLPDTGGLPPGGHVDFRVVDDWAFVASWGPYRGFSIVDVSDPTDPRPVAHYTPNEASTTPSLASGSYWDLTVFDGGDTVVLAAQALAGTGVGSGRTDQQGGGLYLVDTSDKEDPTLESFTRITDSDALIPIGIHNVRAFTLDGVQYVVATTANGNSRILRVAGEAGSRSLTHVSTIAGEHDTAFQIHPLTGTPLLYTAKDGVFVWNVSDPADPQRVSFVPDGPNLSAYHQVNPTNVLIDGRHVVVAGTEDIYGAPRPYTILDTTDPAHPEIIGQWILEPDVQGPHTPYQFTSHNFDIDRGRIYAAYHHAGVWVVDISNLTNARDPFAVGFHEPHQDVPYVPRTPLLHNRPAVFSANRFDGHVYAIDINSGLYILEETGTASPLRCAEVFPSNIP